MTPNISELHSATVQLSQLKLKQEGSLPKLYEIRPAGPGKGLGAFAIQPVKRGTRILAEAPLLSIAQSEYLEADIQRSFDKLSAEDKAKYFTLHSNHGQDPKNWPSTIHPRTHEAERQRIEEQHNSRVGEKATILSIFQTNCMEHERGAAVFMDASRFNHSCISNAFFSWNSNRGKETIHAMVDIPAGEEITLCYCDALWDTHMRNWALKHYGFRCACRACGEMVPGSFAAQSHSRRYRMRELQERLDGHGKSLRKFGKVDTAAAVSDAVEMCALLVEEGLFTAELGKAYDDLAIVCEQAGDLRFGYAAACKELEVYETILGSDHPEVESARGSVRRLKKKKLDGEK